MTQYAQDDVRGRVRLQTDMASLCMYREASCDYLLCNHAWAVIWVVSSTTIVPSGGAAGVCVQPLMHNSALVNGLEAPVDALCWRSASYCDTQNILT